jgi:pimeloyl-ACP methyl ester carboxylesterase
MLERMRGDAVHVRLDGGHALPLEQPAVLGGFVASFADRHR